MATNPAGQAVTAGRLTVNRPRHYKEPYFLEPLKASLTDSGTVNLQCKVGSPDVTNSTESELTTYVQ